MFLPMNIYNKPVPQCDLKAKLACWSREAVNLHILTLYSHSLIDYIFFKSMLWHAIAVTNIITKASTDVDCNAHVSNTK